MDQTYKEQSKPINILMAKIIPSKLLVGSYLKTVFGSSLIIIDRRFNFLIFKWEYYTICILNDVRLSGAWMSYKRYQEIKKAVEVDPENFEKFWSDPM